MQTERRLGWLMLASLAVGTTLSPPPSIAAAPTEKLTRPRPDFLAIAPVLKKLCSEGTCQRAGDRDAYVTVLRDRAGNIRALAYSAFGCPHRTVTYHDPQGKFLVAEQPGPREPDEWDSPSDKKIQQLRTGLNEAEQHRCDSRKARKKARD